jgi:hypothetical protein
VDLPTILPPDSRGGDQRQPILAVPLDDEYSSSQGFEQSVMMFKFDDNQADLYFKEQANYFEKQAHNPVMVDDSEIAYPQF